ncbi:MAG: hypothetical protein JWM42_2353 [Burkholderia sp.]|nr:hypothetical protein [Burkholderia sp.]
MARVKSHFFRRGRLWACSMMVSAGCGLCAISPYPHAQAARANPYDVPEPRELQELVKLDDRQLQSRIDTDWTNLRKTLDRFLPPGMESGPHRPSFVGPQKECLENRSASACKIYMRELIAINKPKDQQGGSLLLNPWASTPR